MSQFSKQFIRISTNSKIEEQFLPAEAPSSIPDFIETELELPESVTVLPGTSRTFTTLLPVGYDVISAHSASPSAPAVVPPGVFTPSAPGPATVDAGIVKYWAQRARYLPYWDSSTICTDLEGLFSIVPRAIADDVAARAIELTDKPNKQGFLLVDPMCGLGGTLLGLARVAAQRGGRAVGSELSPLRASLAAHNIEAARKVEGEHLSSIELYCGDSTKLRALPTPEETPVVVSSPPWGGPEYQAQRLYFVEHMPAPEGCEPLAFYLHMAWDCVGVSCAAADAPVVAFVMPRNTCATDYAQKARAAWRGADGADLVVVEERNFTGNKHKTSTFYVLGKHRMEASGFVPPPPPAPANGNGNGRRPPLRR